MQVLSGHALEDHSPRHPRYQKKIPEKNIDGIHTADIRSFVMKAVQFKIEPSDQAAAKKRAKAEGRTFSGYIRSLIIRDLQKKQLEEAAAK